MTRSEWIGVVRQMDANWPHSKIPEMSIAKWFDDCKHLPAEQVGVAVETAYRDGEKFPPNGAQILARVSELGRDDPDHGEAWLLLNKALMKHGVTDWPAFYECLPPSVSVAARRMRFETQGGYLKAEESTVRAQFREMYKNVLTERRRDDAYAGLPDAGLRGLDRAPKKIEAGRMLERLKSS